MQHSTTRNVEIQNIQVQPTIIKVGNIFTVSATLVNNLQNIIYVNVSPCNGPFVIIDNHVTVDVKINSCEDVLTIKKINPGEKIIKVGLDPTTATFRATVAGTTNATITFYYFEKDPMSNSIQSNPQKTISKSFLITISNQLKKQTTESNELYKPTLSDDQVAQIITYDLSKHLPTFTKAIITGRDPIPNNPDYPKFPLHLWYVAPNGTQFYVNSTYSIDGKCVSNNTYCGIHDPSGFKITSGRLVYYVDLLWYAKDNLNGPAQYAVDAHSGDVLYSTLLEDMTPQDIKNKYIP